jgi:uncharacterized membrane protein YbhN (UPF0104 family)
LYYMTLRQVVRISGIVVAASIGFLALKLWVNSQWLALLVESPKVPGIIVIGAIIYGTSELLLSAGWRQLLAWWDYPTLPAWKCHSIYGKTQIAKYLPGNVFHFAGRHVLGRQAGVSHAALSGAAAYEVLGLLSTSGIIALLGFLLLGIEETYLSVWKVLGIEVGALGLATSGIALGLRRVKRQEGSVRDRTIKEMASSLLKTYLLYLFFFLVSGSLLVLLIQALAEISVVNSLRIIAIFAMAWITGFVVPGAPGGLGVREAVIVFLLTPIAGEGMSLAAAVGLRLVTLVGDLWFLIITNQRVTLLFRRGLRAFG